MFSPFKTEEPTLLANLGIPTPSLIQPKNDKLFRFVHKLPQKQRTKNSVTVLSAQPKDLAKCTETDLNLPLNLEVFTFDEIKKITFFFSKDQLLGREAFGSVYKGFIPQDLRNGLQPQPVAVRVLRGIPTHYREWLADYMCLEHHPNPNLVKLIGYTCEGEHHILIYEYLALGSVKNHLNSRTQQPLSWRLRMKVAYGVAKCLTYMHEAENPVVLGIFTTANILLDKDYNPKLSDFGYVRNIAERGYCIVGRIPCAPEFMEGHFSSKCDVYSFGVVLLELLTGRKPHDRSRPPQEQNLVQWALPFLEKKWKCLQILDPRLKRNYPIEGVYKGDHASLPLLERIPRIEAFNEKQWRI